MVVAALATAFVACNEAKNETKTETPAMDSSTMPATDSSTMATKVDSAVSM